MGRHHTEWAGWEGRVGPDSITHAHKASPLTRGSSFQPCFATMVTAFIMYSTTSSLMKYAQLNRETPGLAGGGVEGGAVGRSGRPRVEGTAN